MMMASGFRTPEEAALGLDLPLVGTLPVPGGILGPVAASYAEDEKGRNAFQSAAGRLLESPLSAQGPLGVIGDLPGPRLAAVTYSLAVVCAQRRAVVLVDADLSNAQLAFDRTSRAQEGLVDVLRYGVKSARLIAPTGTPGLSLLPVGAGTVDVEGTFGSPVVADLFADLAEVGELVMVNGPSPADLELAEPFTSRVAAWVLICEVGHSTPEVSARLVETLGRERFVGVVAVAPGEVVERRAAADVAVAGQVEPAEPVKPVVPVEPAEPTELAAPTASPTPEDSLPVVPPEETVAAAPVVDVEGSERGPTAARPRSRRGVLIGGVGVLVVAAILVLRGLFGGGPGTEEATGSAERAEATGTPGAEVVGIAGLDSVSEAGPGPGESAAAEEEMAAVSEVGGESVGAGATRADVAATASLTVSPAKEETPPDVSSGWMFGVHVSSLTNEESAWRDAERFRRRGYSVAVRGEEIAGKGYWYRLYVGPYGEREEANRIAAEIRESGLEDYTLIRRVPASVFEQRQGGGRGER